MTSLSQWIHGPWRKFIRWSQEYLKEKKYTETKFPGMVSKEGIAICVGALFLITGIFLTFTWETILESQVNKEFILSETSKTYQPWLKTRVEVYTKFYFWNWTNPKDMREPDFKPILVQMGPYAYREITEKVDIVFNKNGTVTYKRRRRWYFDPEKSNGTEDDMVTTLNVVAKSAAFITRYNNYMTRMGLNVALSSTQTMDVTKPVRQLLFEGYRNTLIDTAKNLPLFAGVSVPFDRFGWFYKRNGSTDQDGVFNIETGVNGMDSFGEIRSWNYQKFTKYFPEKCGQVRGSAGDFFPQKRTKQDVIELYSPDLCRFVTFHFDREEMIHGMVAYRYETRSSLFDNGEENPDNVCFCNGECAPPGALNVSTCRLGAPAFVSFPHFYQADSVYRDGVVGMKPDPEHHGSHMTIEPRYGIPLDVAARFQINILITPYRDLSMYSGLTEVYFPVVWFEQTANIPEETVKAIKTLLILPTIGTSAAIILIVVGSALILTVIALHYCRKRQKIPINDPSMKTGNGVDDKRSELKLLDTRL